MKIVTALFPLPWVTFPGEDLNLHIFEERYRHLFQEIRETGEPFGIPVFRDGALTSFGCLATLREIRKEYPDGKLDVQVRGTLPFEILEFFNPMPGRLFPGGKIKTWVPESQPEPQLQAELEVEMQKLFSGLGQSPKLPEGTDQSFSFRVAHKLGLDTRQEMELLTTREEGERLTLLLEYVRETLEGLKRVSRAQNRIRQNGHFKSFDPLSF